MKAYPVKSIIDGQPTFEKPMDVILAEVKEAILSCPHGGAFEFGKKNHVEYITERQRKWYKGICLPALAKAGSIKADGNGEPAEWWDTEVKKQCDGLSLLNKEVFMWESAPGYRIPIGRLTTKGVGIKKMTAFIKMILSRSMDLGWNVAPPDPDLRKKP